MSDIPYPLITDDFNDFRIQMLGIIRDLYENKIGGASEGDVFKVTGDVLELQIAEGSALKKVDGKLDVDMASAVGGSGEDLVELYGTKGNILAGKGPGYYPFAVTVGTNGQCLLSDSTTSAGVKWGDQLTASVPVYITNYVILLKNNAGTPAQVTAIDTGTLADSDTVIPTSKAVKTAVDAKLSATSLVLSFYTDAGVLDTIPLTADQKLTFFDSTGASNDIALTT